MTTRRPRPGRLLRATPLALLLLPTLSGAAEYIPAKDKLIKKDEKKEPHQGWSGRGNLGANFSFGTNTNVVGQQDGASITLGGTLSSALDFRRKQHEWRNSLDFKESFARTPAIPEFVKASDQLLFESIYLFRPQRLPWLGPFARFVLDTPVLEGRDFRAEPVTYLLPAGHPRTPSVIGDQLKLTDVFAPLTLKQSAGAFAKPIEREPISVEARLGLGAIEVFGDDQFAINDDAVTPEIEVVALADMVQAGTELNLAASGSLSGNKVSYKAGIELLVPFISNKAEGDDRGAFELMNVDLLLRLSFKLVSWASLDYEFRAVRKPQLLDKFQIQNNLLLTFSYSLVRPEPAKDETAKE